MVRNGQLISPPVYENILEGIPRSTIIELARDLRVDTIERPIDRSELYMADELFYCGTAFEVGPIIEVDHRCIGQGALGPMTRRLQEHYTTVARGKTARGSRWRWGVYRQAGRKAPQQGARVA